MRLDWHTMVIAALLTARPAAADTEAAAAASGAVPAAASASDRAGSMPTRRAAAGLPGAYGALVIQPTMTPQSGRPARVEFDLTAALARARREQKSLYVYLGAEDCPYCRRYEAFLAEHAAELVPHFAARYLVVDLRSSLSVGAAALHFKVGELSRPYAQFMQALGDERARLLVYPSVWLLDADLRPLMQMPAGTGTFQTVPEQLEILQLVQ